MSITDLFRRNESAGQVFCRRSFYRYMRADDGLSQDLAQKIWHDPQALLADGNKLHVKLSCTVAQLDHPTGSFVFKCQDLGDLVGRVRKSLSETTAHRSWRNGRLLEAAGIPTPRARAFVERRIGPFRHRSYFLTDYVPGTTLYRLMRHDKPHKAQVHDLARQVAEILQRLDQLHICHKDFKTENILVDPQGKVWLIDLERIGRYRRPHRLRERQARDVRDLLHPRNWRSNPEAAEVFRKAILRTPVATQLLSGSFGAEKTLGRPVPPQNRPAQLATVLIPCRNAAETILPCLDSVRDIADEILVADAGSTDNTLELVRASGGCTVLEKKCSDPLEFVEWARQQAQHSWILQVLPYERLNPELGRQVQDKLAREPDIDGFQISRTPYLRAQPLRHGGFQDDSSIRLYRKNLGQYELRNGQPELVLPQERTGRISSRLMVELCSSMAEYLTEIIRSAIRAAQSSHQDGNPARPRAMLWRVPWRFLDSYVWRSGWLDGWAGLHACCLAALEIYVRETVRWDLQLTAGEDSSHRPRLRRAA